MRICEFSYEIRAKGSIFKHIVRIEECTYSVGEQTLSMPFNFGARRTRIAAATGDVFVFLREVSESAILRTEHPRW